MWDELSKRLIWGTAVVAALALPQIALADEPVDESPVVVELFTAQNCGFCPPANAYLSKLAQRDDVIALSFIVDYWNSPEYSHLPNHQNRQRAYGHLIGKDRVYTPEMVIGGERHATGYRRFSVSGKIKSQLKQQNGGQLRIAVEQLAATIHFTIPPGSDAETVHDIILIPFKSEMTVSTQPGPQDDRTYTNVAYRPRVLGHWDGRERKITVAITNDTRDTFSGLTLLVQEQGHGAIKGAKMIRIDGRS